DCHVRLVVTLPHHLRDNDTSLSLRKNRLYYLNYTQPLVSLYVHYIFSKPAIRKESPQEVLSTQAWEGDILAAESLASGEGELGSLPENPQLSEWVTWLKNVDRQGTSIDRYMADASRYA